MSEADDGERKSKESQRQIRRTPSEDCDMDSYTQQGTEGPWSDGRKAQAECGGHGNTEPSPDAGGKRHAGHRPNRLPDLFGGIPSRRRV